MTPSLDALFPLPSPPPSAQAPAYLPGVTHESSLKLIELLKENHVKHHIFFNEMRFHNHLSHHLLAAYAMGGTPQILKEAYDEHASYQRPMLPSEVVDANNWKDHLGDEKFYKGYLDFFSEELLSKGVAPCLEKYLFAYDSNWGPEGSGKDPKMLARFFSGLLHPMIHTGYGVEFGLPGIVAEGLAQAAVHLANMSAIMPKRLFTPENQSIVGTVTQGLTNINLGGAPSKPGVHSFTLLKRISEDRSIEKPAENDLYSLMNKYTDKLLAYFDEWNVEGPIEEKVEEMVWLASLIYGVGAWRKGQAYRADFFLMHLVNCSLFAPSILALLSPSSQRLLARSFVSAVITFWLTFGRPRFPIAEFFANTNPTPRSPLSDPKPGDSTLDKDNLIQNPWYPLISSVLSHPDEHLLKLQRSLAHNSALYGRRPKGTIKNTELPDAELLDGTLFLRAAGLSMDSLGWVREGEERKKWYRNGFWDWDELSKA